MKKILGVLIVGLFLLTSCGSKQTVDIINPDADLLYFFGATCPHCQELNRRATEEDLFSKISVEKREVYYNDANRQLFIELTERIKAERTGVPFVYDKNTGEYVVGVEPAYELFKSYVDKKDSLPPAIDNEETTEETNIEKPIIEDTGISLESEASLELETASGSDI